MKHPAISLCQLNFLLQKLKVIGIYMYIKIIVLDPSFSTGILRKGKAIIK